MAKAAVRVKVSDEDFVTAWLKSSSVKGVAESVDLSVNSCSVRAATLRKAGVNLPKYARLRREIAVTDLNKLIRDFKKK